MNIYVASSWRNVIQQDIVKLLRDAGHEVYDFKNPKPGNAGFSWRQCATEAQLRDPVLFRDEVLTSDVAKAGFDLDMNALRACDACVLVLPCGRSAHLELGWAVGAGKCTIALLETPMSEPELMVLMCDALVTSADELVRTLDCMQNALRAFSEVASRDKCSCTHRPEGRYHALPCAEPHTAQSVGVVGKDGSLFAWNNDGFTVRPVAP